MRLRSNPPRHQVWTDEQVTALIGTAAPLRPSIASAVALAHHTGQREADIRHMAWSQFDGTAIRLRQRKTGVLLDVPCTAQLLDLLASTPRTGIVMVINETTGSTGTGAAVSLTHSGRWRAPPVFPTRCNSAISGAPVSCASPRPDAACQKLPRSAATPSIRTAKIFEVYLPSATASWRGTRSRASRTIGGKRRTNEVGRIAQCSWLS